MDAMYFIENDSSFAALFIKKTIYDNLSVSYDSLKDIPNAYMYLSQAYKID